MRPQEIKEIFHNIDFNAGIRDNEALFRTISVLLNLVESLSEENEKLKIETGPVICCRPVNVLMDVIHGDFEFQFVSLTRKPFALYFLS